jgi:hypothetical protein
MTPSFSRDLDLDSVLKLSDGLQLWKEALVKGHTPEPPLPPASWTPWPEVPELREALYRAVNRLQLPSLTARHPVLTTLVLRTILDFFLSYQSRLIDPSELVASVEAQFESIWYPAASAQLIIDSIYGPAASCLVMLPPQFHQNESLASGFSLDDGLWSHDG